MNKNPIVKDGAMPDIEIPKPGSKEAVERGCTCRFFSVMLIGEDYHNTEVFNTGCPLHDPERRE